MYSFLKKATTCSISAVLLAVAVPSASSANATYIPTPRIKPIAPNSSALLSKQDARLLRTGMTAAKKGRWNEMNAAHAKLSDKAAKDLLMWMRAEKDPHMSMEDFTYVTHQMSDWPRMTVIRARAEKKLFDRPLPARETIDWFRGLDPVSGEGRAALASAYYTMGDTHSGDQWLKKAWRESRLTRDGQKKIFGEYKSRLTADDHAARADHLIWAGRAHHSKAQALMPFMTPGQRALTDARIRVSGNRHGMDAAIANVPATLTHDTGLLYERARWRRRKKTKDYALPLYLQMKNAPVSSIGQRRVWREKKIMAYWAIEKGRFHDAYNLVQHHGMTRGSSFAEAEFLAGWLALTKLNRPSEALDHFTKLRDGVSYPVSLSRANYWLGRTHEALASPESSLHYANAARFNNTFYGFLAAERMHSGGGHVVALPQENYPSYLKDTFESDPRVRAMRLLGEAGEERRFNQFAFHLDDHLESQEHLTLLASVAKQYGYMKPSLRAAKQASRFQSMLTESGYPMPEAITGLPDKFEIPFVLAIARQESEFNHRAVSHARAYGLMQMINATARSTARQHRIPYNRSRMTTDIHYSANLGALHLHDLLRKYDGSYIMAAAAYNAGPSRVSKWVRTYGDPRTGEVDPVDWLESLPYSETRNYVHRVMENLQVYRARMNNNMAENRVLRDITTGAF